MSVKFHVVVVLLKAWLTAIIRPRNDTVVVL